MKGKIAYLFYDEEGDVTIYSSFPYHKQYQGKLIKIVYFEVEEE